MYKIAKTLGIAGAIWPLYYIMNHLAFESNKTLHLDLCLCTIPPLNQNFIDYSAREKLHDNFSLNDTYILNPNI